MLLFGESNVYRLIRLSVTTAWRPHTSRLESQRDVAFFFVLENDESTRREEIYINFNACQLENDNDNKFPIKQGNNKFYEFLAASASSFFQTTRTHKTNTDDGCGWDVKIVFILSRFNILSLCFCCCYVSKFKQNRNWDGSLATVRWQRPPQVNMNMNSQRKQRRSLSVERASQQQLNSSS